MRLTKSIPPSSSARSAARWQPPAGTQRALLVGGGVGAAPLFMLCRGARRLPACTSTSCSARKPPMRLRACERYEQLLLARCARCATDDGTLRPRGLLHLACAGGACRRPLRRRALSATWPCCGPEPLMKIVAGHGRRGRRALRGLPGEAHGLRRRAPACRAWWTRWTARSAPASTARCSMQQKVVW